MKRSDCQTIGDLLRQFLSDADMEGHLNEIRAEKVWPAIVGEHIATQCARPHVIKGIMTVRIRNASLRQELNMARSSLIRSINDYLGTEIISEIRFTY